LDQNLAETQALIREAYSSIHWVLRLGYRPWHLELAWNLPYSFTFYFISDKADQISFLLLKWLRITSGIKYFQDDMVLWHKHMFYWTVNWVLKKK
jgi:hypothetical protein